MTQAPAAVPVMSDFEAIYTEHFALVWRALRGFGVPLWLAEDAAQDVFLIWYRQSDKFRGESQVSSYLYSIARRVAANVRRTGQRTERRHHALRSQIAAPSPGPEEVVADQQAELAFGRAIAGLPVKLRQVYLLAAQDGLTAQQIGLALGLSANTVSSRIRLTRARLAAELRDLLPAQESAQAEPVAEARSRVWAVLLPLLPLKAASVPVSRMGPVPALAAAMSLVGALVLWSSATAPQARAVSAPLRAMAPVAIAERSAPAPEPAASPAAQLAEAAPAPAQAEGDPLAREAGLLALAQRRLREGDPDAALAQLRVHATRFVDGVLADERDALIAAALCQRGELAAGQAVAAELAARAPGSTALSTAYVACEDRSRRAGDTLKRIVVDE